MYINWPWSNGCHPHPFYSIFILPKFRNESWMHSWTCLVTENGQMIKFWVEKVVGTSKHCQIRRIKTIHFREFNDCILSPRPQWREWHFGLSLNDGTFLSQEELVVVRGWAMDWSIDITLTHLKRFDLSKIARMIWTPHLMRICQAMAFFFGSRGACMLRPK